MKGKTRICGNKQKVGGEERLEKTKGDDAGHLTSWHGETSVSEMICSTQDRRQWANMTNQWHMLWTRRRRITFHLKEKVPFMLFFYCNYNIKKKLSL